MAYQVTIQHGHLLEVPPLPGSRQTSWKSSDLQEVVQRVLEADPIWAAYAIADLQPEMAPNCRWLAATSADGDALALIYRGLEPPILLTAGEPALLAQLLAQEPLPPAVYASIREEHRPAVTRHYDLNGDIRPMWRMVLADPQAALDHTDGATMPPVRLAGTAAPAVLRLLAHGGPFSPDAFSPAQIDQGVFFGIYDTANRDGGVQPSAELLAVGGTHIVYHAAGIAAIGNMYTRPDQRRRGHSAAVLRAIVRELLRQGMTTIVLNVDQRNRNAQPLYLKHGFVVHIPYLEGKGSRHA